MSSRPARRVAAGRASAPTPLQSAARPQTVLDRRRRRRGVPARCCGTASSLIDSSARPGTDDLPDRDLSDAQRKTATSSRRSWQARRPPAPRSPRPMAPDATNKSKGFSPSTNHVGADSQVHGDDDCRSSAERSPARRGKRSDGENPTPSRASANNNLAAPTAQASAQPKALITTAPSVITSPTQPATYREPVHHSNDPGPGDAPSHPLSPAPKPIIATRSVGEPEVQATEVARVPQDRPGDARRGVRVSSPSVAAALRTANDEEGEDRPEEHAETPVPGGTVNTDRSTP